MRPVLTAALPLIAVLSRYLHLATTDTRTAVPHIVWWRLYRAPAAPPRRVAADLDSRCSCCVHPGREELGETSDLCVVELVVECAKLIHRSNPAASSC